MIAWIKRLLIGFAQSRVGKAIAQMVSLGSVVDDRPSMRLSRIRKTSIISSSVYLELIPKHKGEL